MSKIDADFLRRIKMLEEKVDANKQTTTEGGIGFEEAKKIYVKIEEINDRVIKMGDNYDSRITLITEKMAGYTPLKDFIDFKAELSKSLEDMLSQIAKRFAEKAPLKKWMTNIEIEIKKLYEMFDELVDHNETAMLSKKPLGGISCASCEKNLINLQGIKSQFLVWGKFPRREGDKALNK